MSDVLVLALLVLPWGYLGLMASRRPGLKQQPCIAIARTPRRFRDAVEAGGGASAVRAGLWLDVVFVVWYAVTATYVLREGLGWWLPMAAALLDLAENAVIASLLRRAPTLRGTTALAALAVAKFLLYGAGLVALAVTLLDGSRG